MQLGQVKLIHIRVVLVEPIQTPAATLVKRREVIRHTYRHSWCSWAGELNGFQTFAKGLQSVPRS